MVLTTSDFADSTSSQCDFSKAKSTQLVESILELIKASLESGEDALLPGFGKFCVRGKSHMSGRNPVTGYDMTLEARRLVTLSQFLSPQLTKQIA